MKRLNVNFGLRADHLGQWYGDGPGNAVFDIGAYAANPTANNAGLVWHAIDPSVPQSGFPSKFTFNPRLGFAYDVFGTGKLVARGGFAIFPYQIAYNTTSGPEELPFGVINFSTNRGLTSLSDILQLQRADGHRIPPAARAAT